MININKFTAEGINEISQFMRKNIERSDFDKYYLFTQDQIEKARIFILTYRFLFNLTNILDDSVEKEEINKELINLKEKYDKISNLLNKYDTKISFGRQHIKRDIINELTFEIDQLIDVFGILSEKVSQIHIQKIAGFVLEGKSGDAYKKIFTDEKDKHQEYHHI